MAELQVLNGPLQWKTFKLSGPRFLMGRKDSCHLVLKDGWVSREHTVIIEVSAGEYLVQDLGSENGIYVNGQRVNDATLCHADVLRVGRTEMRFVSPESASDITSSAGGGRSAATVAAAMEGVAFGSSETGEFDQTVLEPGKGRERSDHKERVRRLEKLLLEKEEDNSRLAAENAVFKRALSQGGLLDPATGTVNLERLTQQSVDERTMPRGWLKAVTNPLARITWPGGTKAEFINESGRQLDEAADPDLAVGAHRLGLIGLGASGARLASAFRASGWRRATAIVKSLEALEGRDLPHHVVLGEEAATHRDVGRIVLERQLSVQGALRDGLGIDRTLHLALAGLEGETGMGALTPLLELLQDMRFIAMPASEQAVPTGAIVTLPPEHSASPVNVDAVAQGLAAVRRLHDSGKVRPWIVVDEGRLASIIPGSPTEAPEEWGLTIAGGVDALLRLSLLAPLRGDFGEDVLAEMLSSEGLSSFGLAATQIASGQELEDMFQRAFNDGWLCPRLSPSRGRAGALLVMIGSEVLSEDASALTRLESAVAAGKRHLPQARVATGIYEDAGVGIRMVAWTFGLPIPEQLMR